ncbi:Yip1 domain-containing protein [Paracoccus halophilus]|uniref:Yip1 domain-containing protein n=1 Tax=Paracoccus halophilus TaxID=376733 RepID=A0A1I0TZU2_9RHOB|nr:YIP1 family protein [Paracoccus halophilus]SFA57391.1 Yip1 domain-containing protein [Paracoccus halophilus]
MRLGNLAILTLRDAGAAMRVLRGLDLPMPARWMALFLAIVLSRILGVLLTILLPVPTDDPLSHMLQQPLTMAGIQLAGTVLSAVLVVRIGRMFGGTGNFADALLAIAWIELVLVAVQVVQIAMLLLLPATAALVGTFAAMLSIYLTVTMTKALHGFRSALMVALVYFGFSLLLGLALMQIMPEMFMPPEVLQ